MGAHLKICPPQAVKYKLICLLSDFSSIIEYLRFSVSHFLHLYKRGNNSTYFTLAKVLRTAWYIVVPCAC